MKINGARALGIKVNTIMGPWASLGIHVDFKHLHVDLHILWWVIILGNTAEVIHCGYCQAELAEGEDCECKGPKSSALRGVGL